MSSNCGTTTYCSYNLDTSTGVPTSVKATKADDCSNRLHDTEKNPPATSNNDPMDKCCYIYYSKEKEGACTAITKKQYDNIKKYVQRSEYKDLNFYYEGDLRIDCSSFFMKIGLLSVVLFLL